jgi:two-component system, OmpR family, sensor histidine kinase KdpD
MNTENKAKRLTTGKQYFFSTVILFFFITILYTVQDITGYETVSMILLLIIFLLPLFNFSKGPIILSAIISALAWDYYFIPPHFTMYMAKTEDIVMLFMFFIVAVTNGILTSKLKVQKNNMVEKDRRLESSYILVKELSSANDLNEILNKMVHQVLNTFGFESVIFLPEDNSRLKREAYPSSTFKPDEMEWLAAETSFKEKIETGKTTSTINGADAIYFPVIIKDLVFCIIGVKISDGLNLNSKEIEFLRNFIKEIIPFLEKYSTYSRP